jgi:pimeloyl-ACP methyl ester carboxylesterase
LVTALALLGLAALLAWPAGAAAPPAGSPAASPPPWEAALRPCSIPQVAGGARCGTYEVFEDRESRSGRKIPLRIVLLPALGPRRAPDPVFLLSGGPGEGAVASAPEFANHSLRRGRDVVLVDTRGTGGSNPLSCRLWGDGTRLDHIFPLDAVRACRDELRKRADLTRYTTAAAMDDLDEVRRHLGFGRVNLVGISYGTLAAQVFLARHPEGVRSLVLSGVAKPGDPAPLYHARNAQRALELLARDCARDAHCHAAFPRFEEELAAALAHLARQPARVQVTSPESGRPAEVVLTRSAAADAIRFSLYSRKASRLPLRVHQAASGDYRDLARAAVALRATLQQELALGLLFSVSCAEDLWRIDPKQIPAATRGTFYGDDRVREQLAVCTIWPHAPPQPGSGALPPSPAPVLLFSGERDPVTPPADAAQVAAGFPHGLWVQIPSGAHSWDDECEQRLIADFVERGTTQGIDPSCARQPRPLPFATR